MTIGHLFEETLKLGYLPQVLLEYKDMTISGLINGNAVQSSAHKYGLNVSTFASLFDGEKPLPPSPKPLHLVACPLRIRSLSHARVLGTFVDTVAALEVVLGNGERVECDEQHVSYHVSATPTHVRASACVYLTRMKPTFLLLMLRPLEITTRRARVLHDENRMNS